MELRKLLKELPKKIGKYRYAILVLVIGLILMMIPAKKEGTTTPTETVTFQQEKSEEQILAEILSKVEGAGSVQVMLSVREGEQIIYQTDDSGSSGTESTSYQKKTVIISTEQKNQQGLICQTIPAVYQGAIVLCQGADDPAVRLAITEAVSKITGLGMDRVVVLKMK